MSDLKIRTIHTGIGQRTSTADTWDSDASGAIEIPAGTNWLYVSCDELCQLACNKTAGVPTVEGAEFQADTTNILYCWGSRYLHYKNGTAGTDVTVGATAAQDV